MKSINFLAVLSLSVSSLAYAAGGHDHGGDHKPLHGCIVVEANHMDLELVATSNTLSLYLRDHDNPIDVSKASAKITLLNGNQKREVELQPVVARMEGRHQIVKPLEARATVAGTHLQVPFFIQLL